MLVLSRRLKEEIVIDGNIRVVVLSISGNRVRLGIDAPADVTIWRDELPIAAANGYSIGDSHKPKGIASI